jgi:hypothetical protein
VSLLSPATGDRVAVDSLRSNSRNDGMQKGMPEGSRTLEENIGENMRFHFSTADASTPQVPALFPMGSNS